MDKINNLIAGLLAIANYAKDIHYNAKGDAFYAKHLLADRIEENLPDFIDKLKEVCILGNNEAALPSSEYLRKAINLLPEITQNDKDNFKKLAELIITNLALIEHLPELTKGEDNLIGAIAEDLQNNLGLINRQIKE